MSCLMFSVLCLVDLQSFPVSNIAQIQEGTRFEFVWQWQLEAEYYVVAEEPVSRLNVRFARVEMSGVGVITRRVIPVQK